MNEDTLFEEIVKEVFGTSEIPDIETIKPSDKLSEHMLSRLTEEEKKKCYFDYRRSKRDLGITFDNPIKFLMYENDLNEGLIRTYGITDQMIRNLMEYFHLSVKNFKLTKDEKGNPWGLHILIPSIEKNVEAIKKAMDFYGYFLAKEEFIEKKSWVTLIFEPKFQPQITLHSNVLYHWTSLRHLKKILTVGLSPRSTNTFLKYPNRVYLIDTQDMKEIDIKGNTLYSKEKEKDNCLNNPSDYFKNGIRYMEYVLLKINVGKIQNSISFHTDYNYTNCVYTQDNIPPSAIEVAKYQVFPLQDSLEESTNFLSILLKEFKR